MSLIFGRCGMLPFLTQCLKEKFFNVSRYKFACPPCYYYWLQEIKTHEIRELPSGITFLSDFIKIGEQVQEFKGARGRCGTYTLTVKEVR